MRTGLPLLARRVQADVKSLIKTKGLALPRTPCYLALWTGRCGVKVFGKGLPEALAQ